MEVVETAIRSRQQLIKKFETERLIIQKAAGQFSAYLKRSSIKQYNDSKLAYLDHLIDEEKGKVEVGGSRKRLEDLQADRRQHAEEVRTLTDYVHAGENEKLLDEEGIYELIEDLFSLELMGPNLRKAAETMKYIQYSTHDKDRGTPAQRPTRAKSSKSFSPNAGRNSAKAAVAQSSGGKRSEKTLSRFIKNLLDK